MMFEPLCGEGGAAPDRSLNWSREIRRPPPLQIINICWVIKALMSFVRRIKEQCVLHGHVWRSNLPYAAPFRYWLFLCRHDCHVGH